MAQIVTITNPLTGQPAQVDQLEHTAQQIDDAVARALPGGAIDMALQNKAPAGYGLGGESGLLTADDNIDTLMSNGWYRWDRNNPPKGTLPTTLLSYATNIRVFNMGGTCCQEAIDTVDDDDHGCMIRRTIYGTTAYPWEWVNPPMALGVEYRTTERYLGKPVYVMAVDCGSLPNKTTKTIAHGVSGCEPISVTGRMSNGTNVFTIPLGSDVTIDATYQKIQIGTTSDYSGWTGVAMVKYTKTTD